MRILSELTITLSLDAESGMWVADCLEWDVVTFATTVAEACRKMADVFDLVYEPRHD